MGTIAFAELQAMDRIRRLETDRVARGAYVFVVRSTDGLEAARCESLRASKSVIAAGGISERDILRLRTAPGLLFQTGTASAGALRVVSGAWPPTVTGGGWIAGRSAADELRAGAGWVIDDGLNRQTILAVMTFELRDPSIDRWLLDVRPPLGVVDECWVEFTRSGAGVAPVLLRSWFDGEPGLEVNAVANTDALSRDPAREFASRPEQFAWLPGGAALLVSGLAILFSRRRESALYRAFGLARPLLALLLTLEQGLTLAVGATVGIAGALAVHIASGAELSGHQVALAAGAAVSAALAALVGIGLAAFAGNRSQLAAMIKEG